MSISGVGGYGAPDPSQLLARMLSRLSSTNSKQSGSSTTDSANSGSISGTNSPTNSGLTGTGQSGLSDQIMALLVQMQQQPGSDAAQAGAPPPPPGNDSIQQLFSAMDTDGDGKVSQQEMETYITGKGGTQDQADALFSSLTQGASGPDTSGGILEQQLASDVSQAQQAMPHHHHHHHGGPPPGADTNSGSDIASQIFSALDTNQDGKVSSDELAAAFNTSNTSDGTGTSSADTSKLFSQIDSNGDGSLSSGELGSFLTSLTNQIQSDFNTLGTFGQLAAQSYDMSAGLLNKPNSGQSSYA